MESGFNPALVERFGRDMTDEQLLDTWLADIRPDESLTIRDSIVEAMQRRGVRPSKWLRDREQYGLYADINDPEFASLLLRKTEFASLASTMAPESTCTQSKTFFESTPVQRLVARFLHPTTPYNGILLDHGVGVGKTCSAVTVAETFLEYMPSHTVFIIAPQAIAEGFRNTIFDAEKLLAAPKEHVRLTGERWTSPQCTGMTYLRLANSADQEDRTIIAKEADKLIRRRYAIMGYIAFSNWVKRKLAAAVPATVVGAAREREENAVLTQIFSDHLLIVDEAHNLRDDRGANQGDDVDPSLVSDSAAGKALTPILKRIVEVAEGLRLMLMTATPMYNTAPEIVFLLNLLLLNDTKDSRKLLREDRFFRSDGTFTNKEELAKVARRYVSFMRGENPNTFPIRLTPVESNIAAFVDAYPRISIKRSEGETSLVEKQKNIIKTLPIVVHNLSTDSGMGKVLHEKLVQNATAPAEREDDEVGNFILAALMQQSNITYPGGTTANIGLNLHMKRSVNTVKGTEVAQYTWREGRLEDGSDAPSIDTVFGTDLRECAPKIHTIVECATKGKGMVFVYSRFLPAGAVPVALSMELRGYCRILADGTPAPLLKRPAPAGGYKGYYILLTSDDKLSPNFKGLLNYATTLTSENADGRKVKMIIGSAIASEGLDLKCIRQVHVLDSWYHLNRIEQITGRGVRFCSHSLLPVAERNCLIYLHAVAIPEYETSDLYAYRLAAKKAIPIGEVSREIKIAAWDCMLNIEAIQFKTLPRREITDSMGRVLSETFADRPYTSFCDYMDKCEYACSASAVPEAEIGSDTSTATEFDYRRKFLEKQKILAGIFSTEVAEPLEKIRTIVYGDMPASIATIGLREALGSIRIHRTDGIYGTLVLLNDYIVFQPDSVTDTAIPAAMRYGRAYGRLPRTLVPDRGTLLTYAAVPAPIEESAAAAAPSAAAAVVATAEGPSLVVPAMTGLEEWSRILQEIITKPTGPITRPTNFKEEAFLGIRWVYTRFAHLEETYEIGMKWWMDNVWTPDERAAVCDDLLRRKQSTWNEQQALVAKLLGPVELFQGPINGYHKYTDGKLIRHCVIEGEGLGVCPDVPIFNKPIDELIGPAVDRKTDTDDIFGMIVQKSGTTIFKTVDKTAGKVLKLEGAECANQSNLANHWPRLRNLQGKIRAAFSDATIAGLLLTDDEASTLNDAKQRTMIQDAERKVFDPKTKPADPALRITHISHLSLKQICPYMEFLLRFAEMKHVGGKRWFLGLVDAVRAGTKMSE